MYHLFYAHEDTLNFEKNLDLDEFCSLFLGYCIDLQKLEVFDQVTISDLKDSITNYNIEVFTTVIGSDRLVRLTVDEEDEMYDGLPWDDIVDFYNEYYMEEEIN